MRKEAKILEEHPAGPLGRIATREALSAALLGEFSAHVHELMRAQGLTQARVADAIGRAKSTVGCWLSERREPSFADFYRLSNALGVSPSAVWRAMTKGFR